MSAGRAAQPGSRATPVVTAKAAGPERGGFSTAESTLPTTLEPTRLRCVVGMSAGPHSLICGLHSLICGLHSSDLGQPRLPTAGFLGPLGGGTVTPVLRPLLTQSAGDPSPLPARCCLLGPRGNSESSKELWESFLRLLRASGSTDGAWPGSLSHAPSASRTDWL